VSEPLATYLDDHLSGAQIAIQVLQSMRDDHDEPRLRAFAARLMPDIESDVDTLRSIAEEVGAGPSVVKQAGGRLLEKLARLKLGHTGSTDLGTFESLELYSSGYMASYASGERWRQLPHGMPAPLNMISGSCPAVLSGNTQRSRP
jgi:hypothetical protein